LKNIGIQNSDNTASLSIIGGTVQPIDPDSDPSTTSNPITLIDSQGPLTVTGLEVNMTNARHEKASTGIVLRARGSSVTGSTIRVPTPSTGSAVGIEVQAISIVEGNTFIGAGANSVGITGGDNLLNNALLTNNFSGFSQGNRVRQ